MPQTPTASVLTLARAPPASGRSVGGSSGRSTVSHEPFEPGSSPSPLTNSTCSTASVSDGAPTLRADSGAEGDQRAPRSFLASVRSEEVGALTVLTIFSGKKELGTT